jgi:predicted ATPase
MFEVDIDDIEASGLPEGIGDLMKLRMKDLDDSEIKILQIASCIGSRVTKYKSLHRN